MIETEFGKIIVNGKTYTKDILIDTNGALLWRTKVSEQFYGTAHSICREDIADLLNVNPAPRYLIIGMGHYGACRLETGVQRECDKKGTILVAKKTPEAVKVFNDTTASKVALFHVTC